MNTSVDCFWERPSQEYYIMCEIGRKRRKSLQGISRVIQEPGCPSRCEDRIPQQLVLINSDPVLVTPIDTDAEGAIQ